MENMAIRFRIPQDQAEEFLTIMYQWKMMIPTMYFLDICSISHIKTYLANNNFTDDFHKKSIQALQSYDIPRNKISIFTAILEKSGNNKCFTTSNFENELLGDLRAVKRFFQNAEAFESEDFIMNSANNLIENHVEQAIPVYLEFLQFANGAGLHNVAHENKRYVIAKNLCDEAQNLGVSRSHPVVFLTIACLYGCKDAQKIMKFSGNQDNFKPLNALGDIQALSRIAKAKQLIMEFVGHNHSHMRCEFVTADTALSNLTSYFTVENTNSETMSSGSIDEYTASADSSRLFPDLFDSEGRPKNETSKNELKQILELLGTQIP